MKLITIFTFSLGLIIILLYRNKRKRLNFKDKKFKDRITIKEWMLFSSSDRNRIDEESRIETMRRKKELLKKIRKEYLKHKSLNKKKI